jgi:hypothetical protein
MHDAQQSIMLEAICVRRTASQGAPLDVGLLVEALVFYQKGHIVADAGTLEFLISRSSPEFLLALIDRDLLTLSYLENMPGCLKSEKPGRGPRYDFALISSPKHTLEQSLPRIVREAVKDESRSERLTRRLFSVIKVDKHHASIPELAREDAINEGTVERVIEELIRYKAPGYEVPSPLVFRFEKTDDLFSINTNLDFGAINGSVSQSNPQADLITPESLLVHLPEVNSDLHFAAKMKADLLTRPENNLIAGSKLGEIFSSIKAKNREIGNFQDFLFEDGRAIREAINSGGRSLEDSLALIDASKRFKQWIRDKDPSADLLKEYCRELSHLEWADKLPTKSLRWLVFGGLGFVTGVLNPLVGLGIGAVDTFLVDKLLKGWRPNQFVEGPLRKFLKVSGNKS